MVLISWGHSLTLIDLIRNDCLKNILSGSALNEANLKEIEVRVREWGA